MALVQVNPEPSPTNSSDFVQEVLKLMGWNDGNFLPIADENNLKLIDLIRNLSENKIQCNESLQDRKQELGRVGQLHKNAINEFDQNLMLLAAHKSQYTTEHHLFKLAENDGSRWKRQIKEADKERKEYAQLEESSKNEIVKLTEMKDKLLENIQWAKSALSEWREVMLRGDQTNKLIQKFCKQDLGRAEALDARRRLLHEQIIKQRAFMINMYEEKKSLEVLLDRTSQLYRQAHMERRNLVNTWKDAVSQMNQREKDIRDIEKEIDRAKIFTESKLRVLQKEEAILNMKREDNFEIELQISELNIASSDLRNRFNRLEDAINLKSSELLALRKTVQNESQKLSTLRNQNRQMLNEEKEKETILRENAISLEKLKEKYGKFKNSNSNAQDRLKQIEELLEAEEKNMKVLQDDTARLNGTLYRSEQQLFKLQEAEKSYILECQMLECGIAKTRTACKALEKELLRQTEILYNVDYKIQNLQMKIANVIGDTNEEEAVRTEEKKNYLESLFEEKERVMNSIQAQIEKTETDMRKMTANYQSAVGENEKLNHKLKEKKIFVEGGEKQLKQIQQDIQEKLVDQNLLKMRIIQMEKQMAKQNDRTFSLEKHKMELEAAMRDRLIDIKTQRDILLVKKKCLLDERAQMKADIGERMLKIEQLKKRYECAIDLLGKNDDGTLKTAVQIKIENAQEKYLLLNEGNSLNEKISKAQSEIKSMENTLRLMNFSNNVYKKQFERVNEDSPELKKMNDLQNRYSQNCNNLRSVKHNLTIMIESLEKLHEERDELEKMFEEVQRTKLDSNDTLLKIHKELMDQETKLERAERELKISSKAAKRRVKDLDFLNLFEKDMHSRERDDRNNSAMQQLADLVDCIPEMSQTVTRHFLEKGLSLPVIRRARSQMSWKSECSLTEYSVKNESVSKKYLYRSILSGSSTSTSSDHSACSSKASAKPSVSHQSGLSVVKISFPDDSKKQPKPKNP